ncbi:MAG: TonB-dependent receptor [Burkholderiaceae bacterium]
MHVPRILLAPAALSALALAPAVHAQTPNPTDNPAADTRALPEVVVTSAPFNAGESAQILAPAKVLAGDELRDKLGNTLGDTLSQELGVSASAFGAGASRPILRGMEGPRVKILQNGMSVSDVSSLSNDHAVAVDGASARQIEILRGPAALLYGSGAIGGLVNVVNDRIPTELPSAVGGEVEVRASSVDRGASMALSVDGAAGPIGLHVDGSLRNATDYRIPGHAGLNDPASASGRLPNSFARQNDFGFGASYVAGWGYLGASVGVRNDHYGIPTEEKSFIDLEQTRYDVDGLVRQPFAGIDSFRFRLGVTDYRHAEKEQDGTPVTNFANNATESRWEFTHQPLSGWRGSFGLQTEDSRFSALAADSGAADTVPVTHSTTLAGFLVEERDFGPFRASAGMRLESVRRRPDAASGLPERSFTLGSYSAGGQWRFVPGYALGATLSLAQRAPAVEELYSHGPHESTATYDIGDPALQRETSRNLEISLEKTAGLWRWKANLFHNRVGNYVYGRADGTRVDEEGEIDEDGEFLRRFWSQGNATIRGAEAEIRYNERGPGLSWRLFADTSRGTLENAGNLPLQPATRFGGSVGYRQGAWRSGLSLTHAQAQDRLASFETTVTPAYTLLDASLSHTQRHGGTDVTWFVIAKNLLNQDIRLSTSVLKDIAPQPGRNLIVGVRTGF